jgi:DNA (cytosine-5)-methyltransferase 1
MTEYYIETVKSLLEREKDHKFKFGSFFAGGGGSSTGYRMGGGKPVFVNEFVPEAIETYKKNWPNTKIFPDDIRKLTSDDILKNCNLQKGELDLLDGSPPCSAFSIAGKVEKNWNKNKKYSDTMQKNVEDLFFDYIRMVEGIQPKIFVAENVAGLTKGKSKGYLNLILKNLKECGYQVEARILDAKYLGVPQSRPRLIFVGLRNDLYDQKYKGKFHPRPEKNMVSLSQAFKGLEFTENDKKETDISKYKTGKILKKMEPGEKKFISLQKAHPNKISPCVTATTGYISAREVRHWDNRAFTVNEVKRIMSIPDDYILTGIYVQKIERLGRMVAPLMYKKLSENLINQGIL